LDSFANSKKYGNEHKAQENCVRKPFHCPKGSAKNSIRNTNKITKYGTCQIIENNACECVNPKFFEYLKIAYRDGGSNDT